MEPTVLQIEREQSNKHLKAKPETAVAHKRMIGLDILRAIAIMLVVLYHSFPMLAPLVKLPVIGNLLNKVFVLFDWLGPLGVDLFFVLSGFLIGSILIKTFCKTATFGIGDIKNFWIRRWFRTVPNYWFYLTIAFTYYSYAYHQAVDWRYYFFLQNLSSPHPAFFAEGWSLAVEEWFYLSLPLFLLLMSKVLKGQPKKKVLNITFSVYLLTFIALRLAKAVSSSYTDMDEEIRKVVMYRLDAVMYGVVIANIMDGKRELLFRLKRPLFIAGLVGSLTLIVLFFLAREHSTIYKSTRWFHVFIDSSYFTLIPLFFSMLLPAAYFFKDLKHKMLLKIVQHISLISYSLYLVHYALVYIPFFKSLKNLTPGGAMLHYGVYWLIIITLSTISYFWLEVPFIKLRSKFSKSE